jgi:Domain of unknown function (DUF5666)
MGSLTRGAMTLVAAFALACGGGVPNGPSSTSASIDGAVHNSSAAAGSSEASLRVSVAGTTMSTTTGSNGRFGFINVPAGDVTLLFDGPGVSARLPLGRVQAGEHVTVGVTVNGSNARLDSRDVDRDDDEDDDDDEADEHEIEGRISSLEGSCPNLTFKIGSTGVKTSGNTRFKDVACTALVNGMNVEAEGTLVNGVLNATKIERD